MRIQGISHRERDGRWSPSESSLIHTSVFPIADVVTKEVGSCNDASRYLYIVLQIAKVDQSVANMQIQ